MGNFAENLNLGNRVRPPLLKTPRYRTPSAASSGVNQSVNIQLPSAEVGEGFLWNIRIKNVSVVEQFKNFL